MEVTEITCKSDNEELSHKKVNLQKIINFILKKK